jgi:hypothetical protein
MRLDLGVKRRKSNNHKGLDSGLQNGIKFQRSKGKA